MINFLTETVTYKVYALDESAYLKTKAQSHKPDEFEKTDVFIGCHYGNPTSAIILGTYVIVSGCGLTIFDTISQQEEVLLRQPQSNNWTNALHHDDMDDISEFQYVGYSKNNQMRVFRMNVLTREAVMLP